MTIDLPDVPGTVIMTAVVGSTAYGLAGPDSDVDRIGTFVAPLDTVLGLDGCAATSASVVTSAPDVTLHEIGKLLGLALKCNPTVLELLFAERHEILTDEGAAILAVAPAVLAEKQVRNSYVGYAREQARRIERRHAIGDVGSDDRVAKHARHCLRLLRAGRALLTTGRPLIDVSSMRDELFAAGELATTDPAAFRRLVDEEIAATADAPCSLPAEPDRAAVEAALVAVRRRLDRSADG